MTDDARLLRAAEALVDRDVLAPEVDARLIEVAVDGRGFRYAAAFWQKADVASTEAGRDEVRLRVAVEWAAVGAPLWWARMEADRALQKFLSGGGRPAASPGSRPTSSASPPGPSSASSAARPDAAVAER